MPTVFIDAAALLAWIVVAGDVVGLLRTEGVERSADLATWSAIQTLTAGGTSITFTDITAPANIRFYYRIVAL